MIWYMRPQGEALILRGNTILQNTQQEKLMEDYQIYML